jgi:hypothetical protein
LPPPVRSHLCLRAFFAIEEFYASCLCGRLLLLTDEMRNLRSLLEQSADANTLRQVEGLPRNAQRVRLSDHPARF